MNGGVKMEKIILSEKQKDIVTRLADPIYTPEYLETWLNRNDNVFVNAPAALSAMGASGFYRAVCAIEQEGYRNCIYMNYGKCIGFNCCAEKDCPQAKDTQPWLFDGTGG
jgi:hypothetical protein